MAGDGLAIALDVEGEGVFEGFVVEEGMVAGTGAAAVEAVQADIEAFWGVD